MTLLGTITGRGAPATARGLLTGDRYRAELDDGRELYLDGKRIANPAEHPAFRPAVDELARLIDLQHDPAHRDLLTWEDPDSGLRLARAYQPPRTLEDLRLQRRSAELWHAEALGQQGRSPAFMASIAVGVYDFRHRLAGADPRFGANAEAWYRHCASNDLVLSHALGDPQIDRSANPLDDPDLALRVVEENDRGIVVRGAKQLTTLAPIAHEVLVYLSASFTEGRGEQFVTWFALPLNTPGLITLAREPLGSASWGTPTRSARGSTSRTRCSSSTTSWCPGTASSCCATRTWRAPASAGSTPGAPTSATSATASGCGPCWPVRPWSPSRSAWTASATSRRIWAASPGTPN